MPKSVMMMLPSSELMQFLDDSHAHLSNITRQGPLFQGVLWNKFTLHEYLIKTKYRIVLLEHNMSLSTILLHSGYVLSYDHVTKVLLADLHKHGIPGVTDPAPRL